MMGNSRLLLGSFVIAVLLNLSDAGLVKKILRNRRETLTGPGGDNVTLPNPHQPVVFNHVYNINVPVGSLCSVDLDSPGGADLEPKDAPAGTRVTEHTLDGENQIVFTHRINIPKQACGCTDGMPELKKLLSRLEMLEGEVSTLREQCTSEAGCCGAQATGNVGIKPFCNGRGNFSSEICGCICEPGWKGPNCSESECPDFCSDQGRCVDGRCQCFQGFGGHNCSLEICTVDCGKFGQCIGGVCVCIEYYYGEDCSQSDCLNNCLGRGQCVDGDCVCDEPWTGFDCSELICPNDCYDRGRCNNGTCECDEGFAGEDCGQRTCPNDCMGRGFCVDGQCVCNVGYTGDDCSSLTCLNDCSGRGRCFNGVCICDTGYQGEDCSQLACLNNCNDRGQCINGQCQCNAGFQGEDCSELSCPNDCRNRGRCVNGQCVCNEGFTGEDCNVKTCPSDCYGRGHCVDGKCVCHAGFTGEDCSELSCPNDCQSRGRCVSGQCVCDEGFTGEDCSLRACPNDCLGRGYCDNGRCVCQEGFAGVDCSELTCPANCNNRGRCVNGACQCEAGFEGDDCGQRSCLNDCHGVGRCVDGQCVCDEGYIGEDCSEVSPPKDLTVTDVNTESVNLTWFNEMLVTEYLVTYIPTAPGGLLLEVMVPGDRNTATIDDLEPGIEYLINVYAVLSNKRSVPVSARVATHLPQPDGLRFKSVRETSVEVSWDQLDFPFDGWDLSFRNTKEENGKILNALERGQTSFEQVGLGPGQEYEVSLGVVKNNTRGPQVTQTFVTKLDTPRQLEVRDVTDTYAVISWSLPVAQVDAITLSFGPASDPSDRKSVDLPSTDTQHTADGLTPDTEYEVTLVSKRGGMTSDPASETFTTDLDAPTNLQVVGQTDNTVTLEWTNSQSDVDRYRVKFSPVSGSAHGEDVFPEGAGDTTQATITGLKPGTEYGIGVTAVKNERESLPATVNAVTDLDPPRELEVTEATETTLTLLWKRPKAKIGNYRLAVYSEADGRRDEVELPGDLTTHTLSSLTPGVRYTLSLVAERGRKRSEPATTSASTEERKPQVGNLTVSDVSWDSFNVSWTIEEGEFEGFVIEVANMEGGPERQNLTLSGDALSLFMSGLSPTSTYMVALYGLHNGYLLGPVFTVATTVKAPVVGNLYVSNVTHKSFSVSWNGTESGFEGFILEVIDTSWQKEPVELNISHNTMSYDMKGLEPSTDYIAYLYGVKKGRRTQAISTVATTARAPNLFGLVVSNVTSDRLSLSWRTGEKAFDNFVVEVRESALPSQAMGRTLPSGARSTVLTGLKGNTRYNIKLYASAGGKNTPALSAVARTEAKAKLGRLSVSKITPSNFTLAWKTVAGHFDGFVIRVSDHKMLHDPLEFTPSGKTRKLTVSGLVDSTAYDVQMYGLSHGRRTPPVSTRTRTASLPKVENLTVSDITPYGFRLSWATRDGDKSVGRRFSRFQVEVSDSGRLLESQEFTVPGNQTSLDIWGLITGIGYEVRLTGVLASGLRSRTLSAVAVTEAEPEIEHLFVSDVTPESFRIAWTVEDGIFDRFVIKVRDAKKLGHPQEFNVAGDERTKVMTGLMGGTEYEIELYGLTLEHRSQPLTAVARTGLGAPRGIRFSDITATSSMVHWTVPRANVDSYRVTFVPLQGGNPETMTIDGTLSETLLPNLIPGEPYQVTVVAVKGLEESDPVTDVLNTALDMPRSLTAVNITDTEALLLWQPAIATVDGYVITFSADTVSPVMERVSGNIVEFEMSSLTPDTQYTVSVYATKDELKSQAATTEFTTELDAPRDLVASNILTDSATLTWTPPRAAITGYILTFEASDGTVREVVLDPYETSYSVTDLSSSTEYTVRLQAVAGAKKSRHLSTTFTTVGVLYKHPKDCSQTLLNGELESGLYTIFVGGNENQPMQVYCDMATDGGGWVVFLRRQSGKLEFFRNWRNYTNGFGDMMDEFWLGLSNVHKLTTSGQYELRVDLRDGSETAYALYDKFSLSEPRSRYKIQIGSYSGTAGDSMTYHQNRPFSTYDNDNDVAVTNCALSYKGAFWYKNCHRVNLMGRYGDNSHSKGINWFHWKGHEHSIPFAEMKIRPVRFGNLEGRRKRS